MIENITGFIIAIALGALIGLEREFSQIKQKFHKYGGIRTFPLIALLGALSAFFFKYSPWILVFSFLSVAALIIIAYLFEVKKGSGFTTEIAGLVTFWIGVLSYLEYSLIAFVLAILMTFILYEKIALHRFAAHIKSKELYSTIKFAIIAFVILPLLPDRTIDPWGFFNPHDIWLMVVLVSGISFLGYIICKLVHKRGAEVSGFLSGFVSSTATTVSMLESKNPMPKAIIASNTAMMIKILIIIAAVNIKYFTQAALPITAMILASGLIVLFFKVRSKTHEIHLDSPFRLRPALEFAAVFSVILFAIKLSSLYISPESVYGIAFITGLFDADAVALSAMTTNIPQAGIIASLAVIANTLSKGALAVIINKKAARKLIGLLLIVVLAGIIGIMLV